ncbi:GTP pyrophosphokinase [Pseudomonas koreensis]|uniref:GTP pyrophosphokinase n=1 Tax=Pseudomonas koreensis TaxID=198620 RepID=UPI003207DA86
MENQEQKEILRKQHAELLPLYKNYAEYLGSLLREKLTTEGIKFHLVEYRAKDTESLVTKATKPEKSYTDPFKEITDLVGLRVIAFYEDDLPKIEKQIRNTFILTREKEVKKPNSTANFGYRSVHYIVRLNPEAPDIGEFDKVADLDFEIQIRTVLQHAWAAISHKLEYKQKNEVPDNLARKLSRLSALFEIADDEFVSLRSISEQENEKIDKKVGRNEDGIPIDSFSLSHYLKKSGLVQDLYGHAKRAGFVFDQPRSSDSDPLSGLIQICNLAGLSTITDFVEQLEEVSPFARDYLNQQYNANLNAGRSIWYASSTFICQLLIILKHPNEISKEKLVEFGWGNDMAAQVLRVARQFQFH